MHQAFVHFQGFNVALVEHRVGADLDVVRTRRGIGKNAVGLEDPNGIFGLAKHLVEALLQQVDSLFGGQRLGLIFKVAALVDVVEKVGKHQTKIGQGWISGMKGVRGGAVELLADQAKIFGTARFQHADNHAVLAAHAPHDLAHRIELTELASYVALDILKLQLLRRSIKGQRPTRVISTVDDGQLFALVLEKLTANRVVPFHRVQYSNWCLRLDQTVGQCAHNQLIIVQPGMTVHALPITR